MIFAILRLDDLTKSYIQIPYVYVWYMYVYIVLDLQSYWDICTSNPRTLGLF